MANPDELKNLFFETVEEQLSSVPEVSFDTYFEVSERIARCESAASCLSGAQLDEDADIKKASQELYGLLERYYGWESWGYLQLGSDKYMWNEVGNDIVYRASIMFTFSADGDFPCGTFAANYDEGRYCFKETMTLRPDHTYLRAYGEGNDLSQITCKPVDEGEYRLYQGDDKQGISILHETKIYDEYASRTAGRSFRGQKAMRTTGNDDAPGMEERFCMGKAG